MNVDHHPWMEGNCSDLSPPQTPSAQPTHTRLSGLDGLRAVAVVAVVLFHADFYWARGGYLGVDLFFVISGFLITSLIAREIESNGRLSLGRFYWRRAKRLIPASFLMTVVIVTVAALVARDALPHLRRDVFASFVYVTNWELLHSQTSYFEAMGRPPLMQHLWSLAIEEQFYILWAPLSLFVLARFGRRRLAAIALILATASATLMGLLAIRMDYPAAGDPSRLYFGTDTHGFALLFGAALGLRWRPWMKSRSTGIVTRMVIWLLGLTALAAMIRLIVTMGENTAFLYPWGFLMTSAASMALIAAATHPGVAFGRLLDNSPMRWIGARSYGIYLWHWPVFMLTRPGTDLPMLGDEAALAVGLGITLVLAECSYRYLEMPVRRGALERIFAGRRVGAWRARVSVVSALLTTVLVVVAVLWEAPVEALPAQDVREALEIAIPTASATNHALSARMSPMPIEAVVAPASAATAEGSVVPIFTGNELTAVGDSVMLGSRRLLYAFLPGTDLHATMGWQAADVIRQLKKLKSNGMLRAAVLIHLGTNGYVTEEQLRQILTMLSPCQRVVLVNTRVPRRWMKANNALIDRVAPDFPNVRVVDWSESSKGRPGYFISDRVHLTAVGQRAFIVEIMRAGDLERYTEAAADTDADSPVKPNRSGDFSPTLVVASQTISTFTFTRESVLKQSFELGDRGEVVRDLQRILGEKSRDGIYGAKLRKKHLAFLRENALSEPRGRALVTPLE